MPAPPKDLLLLRLATVTFTPAPSGWEKWGVKAGEIEVSPMRSWQIDGALKQLVIAAQALKYRPKVSRDDNLVYVPERQRKAAEEAIERSANLIAVSQGCRRHIASASPAVAFVATGEDGKHWLAERAGLYHGAFRSTDDTVDQLNFGADVINQLSDRHDGVALMVEALAHDHAMGRFHEFIRLLERAFARPARLLKDPIAGFLHPRFGYTPDEIAVWVERYRDPATHADARKDFLLETDVRPVISRMEQAAADVLFNKAVWRDPGTDRREVWTPNAGTTDNQGGVFITQGAPARVSAQILDEFNAFPLDLQGIVTPLPAGWWPASLPSSTATAETPLEIRPNELTGSTAQPTAVPESPPDREA